MIINSQVGLLTIDVGCDETGKFWVAGLVDSDGYSFGDSACGNSEHEAIFNLGVRYQERESYETETN